MKVLVICFFLILLQGKVASYLKFDKLTTTSNYNYANASFEVINDKDGEVLLSFVVDYKVEIFKEQILLKLATQKDAVDQNYERVIFNTPVDICKISEGVRSNIITRVVMENFMKSFDHDLKCPFKKVSF